eukprot:SAG31_NODE_1347_length_8693_cov_32.744938_6_plen_149_part_00
MAPPYSFDRLRTNLLSHCFDCRSAPSCDQTLANQSKEMAEHGQSICIAPVYTLQSVQKLASASISSGGPAHIANAVSTTSAALTDGLLRTAVCTTEVANLSGGDIATASKTETVSILLHLSSVRQNIHASLQFCRRWICSSSVFFRQI